MVLDEPDALDSLEPEDPVDPIPEPPIEPTELLVRELDPITIKEFEQEHLEKPKKRKASNNYKLSLSNTLRTNRFTTAPPTAPREELGLSCKKCGVRVDNDDFLGTPYSSGFKVVGYHCHKCNHRWVQDKYREEEARCGQSYMTMGKWEIKRG